MTGGAPSKARRSERAARSLPPHATEHTVLHARPTLSTHRVLCTHGADLCHQPPNRSSRGWYAIGRKSLSLTIPTSASLETGPCLREEGRPMSRYSTKIAMSSIGFLVMTGTVASSSG